MGILTHIQKGKMAKYGIGIVGAQTAKLVPYMVWRRQGRGGGGWYGKSRILEVNCPPFPSSCLDLS